MLHHVFLTGEKRVGKSTLLKKVLARYPGHAGGFLTIRSNVWLGNADSVHMFGLHDAAIPDENNLLFVCGAAKEQDAERFDRLGCEILAGASDCGLLVMDELGPHEAGAALFRQAVLQSLDRTPVLGVLQAPYVSFWPEIAGNPHAEIIELTKDNRDDESLIAHILSALSG